MAEQRRVRAIPLKFQGKRASVVSDADLDRLVHERQLATSARNELCRALMKFANESVVHSDFSQARQDLLCDIFEALRKAQGEIATLVPQIEVLMRERAQAAARLVS